MATPTGVDPCPTITPLHTTNTNTCHITKQVLICGTYLFIVVDSFSSMFYTFPPSTPPTLSLREAPAERRHCSIKIFPNYFISLLLDHLQYQFCYWYRSYPLHTIYTNTPFHCLLCTYLCYLFTGQQSLFYSFL